MVATADPKPGDEAVTAGGGSLPEASAADLDLQAEVAGILADGAMPIAEKQQRLQDLADRYGVAVLGPSADLDGDGEVSPLELQIAEAFGMLAEGGHSYREEDVSEDDDEADGPPARV